eukprot:TRINITY_DN1774_c4_g1_i1.p1 TRINITY_DN1774_c4_g1~~TRINITY_DN1774_c4_g1_i1.p1  ORF type:complete len:455 (+),score=158.61 TRINITY_DN1774_c4_g1_i1:85-1365(+)
MAREGDAAGECVALVRSITDRFPEARGQLAAMVAALDAGEAISLDGVSDLSSRLALTKVCHLLRLKAAARGAGTGFERGRDSVQHLGRLFAPVLGSSAGSDSDGSSSSSSSSAEKKKKKKKLSKKEKKKLKKERKKAKKQAKKKRKQRECSSSSSEPSDPLAAAPGTAPAAPAPGDGASRVIGPVVGPPGAAAGSPAPPPEDDSDGGSSFGPAVPYQQVLAERGYDSGDEGIALPRAPAGAGRKGKAQRDEWMTTIPEGASALGSIDWRRGGRPRAAAAAGGGPSAELSRAQWTATPEEKQRLMGSEARDARRRAAELQEQQEAQRRGAYAAQNAQSRADFERLMPEERKRSLAAIHAGLQQEEKRRRLAGGAAEELAALGWDKETEFDMDGRVDSGRLRRNVANAGADLGRKFGHGRQHFLGGGL